MDNIIIKLKGLDITVLRLNKCDGLEKIELCLMISNTSTLGKDGKIRKILRNTSIVEKK